MWMISPIFLFSFSETLIMNKLDIFCLSSLFISPLFLPYFSHSWNKEKIGSEKKERRADCIWLCQSFGFFYVTQMVKKTPAMQETLVQSLGWEDPLEEGLATHSSILAWRILMDRGAGGLQSMRSQRVGDNWVTKDSTAQWWIGLEKFFLGR